MMEVRVADTRPGGMTRYIMMDGAPFWVDHRGWILDWECNPVPHPQVDEVMRAILAWDTR